MANMQTAAQGAPVMDEAAMAEMRRLIFEAPIQELADAQGISIDEAVQLRVEKNLEESTRWYKRGAEAGGVTVICTTPSSRASPSIRLTRGRDTPSSRAMSICFQSSR